MADASTGERPIAWDEVHRRLDSLHAELDETFHLSPERAQELLDRRARQIAPAPAETGEGRQRIKALAVRIAGERFAIDTRFTREVAAPIASVTPVPGTPSYVRGLVNIRGEILVIFDLASFFGLAQSSRSETARIVVLGADQAVFGILADEVSEVLSLPVDELTDLGRTATHINRVYVEGVTADGMILLDGMALLEDAQLFIDHGRVSEAAAEKTS